MKIVSTFGNEDLAKVYTAHLSGDRYVEFVESKIPGQPREKKWVLIISTLLGCPISCPMCDAGMMPYGGPLSSEEILSQIDYLVNKRYPNRSMPVEKFKIQFARVGEPAFNPAVLDVLKKMPTRYEAPGLVAAISTIAPRNKNEFFKELTSIKNRYYPGRFQLQFSVHSTSEEKRTQLIPYPHWNLRDIAEFGNKFVGPTDKKVTLNFAVIEGVEINPDVIISYFDPRCFLIKFTPLNPTEHSNQEGLLNGIDVHNPSTFKPAQTLSEMGYDVILSIGELEENHIGSNCGQFIRTHLSHGTKLNDAYTYV